MSRSNFSSNTPHLTAVLENAPAAFTNGGSCTAGPDGEWIIEPQIGTEVLITATLDLQRV
jgi:nitrilase